MKKIAVTFISLLFISCRSICVPEYQIFSESEISSKVRIVQVSDFHSNDFGKDEAKLIALIKVSEPDMVVFTGDTFDFVQKGIKPVENVRLLLQGIKDLCPFFYVTGNHEYFKYHENEFGYMIEEYGGKSLHDDAVEIKVRGRDFIIAGADDPFSDLTPEERKKDEDNKEAYIKRILELYDKVSEMEGKNNQAFSILLAHRPEYIDTYKRTGFDLVLSGHAHGGQWRFPAKNGLYAPMQGLFPKYAGGRYEFTGRNGNAVMIVSRGLSYQQPNVPRIMNNPELVVIDIVFRENED